MILLERPASICAGLQLQFNGRSNVLYYSYECTVFKRAVRENGLSLNGWVGTTEYSC